ncbi:MAG: hypothetical protein WC759_02815 [Candidatus Micrarchaeia archaeon]|jgi:ABC-type transport system involved in multi-copper enzyme maturation permease subunit
MAAPKRALAPILLLLIFAAAASAQTVQQNLATMEQRIWTEEFPLVALVTFLALFVIALAYMASQAMMRKEWEAWARSAIFQLGFSFALLIAINVLLLLSNSIAIQLTGTDLYNGPQNYLSGLTYESGFGIVHTLTDQSLQNQLQAINFKFSSNPLTGGRGDASLAGEKTKANAQDTLSNMLMPMIASLYAQQVILRASADFVLPFIIPFAFALRLFPQTRSPADHVLAIAVGFAAILPLTYALNMHIAQSIASASLLAPSAAADPDLYLTDVAPLISQAVFLPNLSIVLTVTFIMAFSKLLVRGFEPEVPYGE